MARKGFLATLASVLLKEAIKQSKQAGKAKRKRSGRPESFQSKKTAAPRHKTKYSIPVSTVKLASRGMHAYPVSGESFYGDNFKTLKFGVTTEETYTTAYLIHDPRNPADSNAIAVAIDCLPQALVLGHIPRHAAPVFAKYLNGRVGRCGARVYFDPEGQYNSVELDCAFPPREEGQPEVSEIPILSSNSPDYSMTQVTTRGVHFETQDFSAENPRFGMATLNEGFSFSPEIRDANFQGLLGFPYETIARDFNLFARSYGGQVQVAYKLDRNEKGRPRLALDASVLPVFKKRG